MKLIIDIDEELFNEVKLRYSYIGSAVWIAVANGEPYEEKSKYYPPCEDCNKKMEEIRRAYDKMKAMERPQGEWIDYDNTFYKCPECGYLLEKDCPNCRNKVILPNCGQT